MIIVERWLWYCSKWNLIILICCCCCCKLLKVHWFWSTHCLIDFRWCKHCCRRCKLTHWWLFSCKKVHQCPKMSLFHDDIHCGTCQSKIALNCRKYSIWPPPDGFCCCCCCCFRSFFLQFQNGNAAASVSQCWILNFGAKPSKLQLASADVMTSSAAENGVLWPFSVLLARFLT